MKLNCEGLPMVYLKPCELFVSEFPTVVSTVLGSCISVTMFSPKFKIGGICHGFLPTKSDNYKEDSSAAENFKYVDCAIEEMAKRFHRLGIRAGELEVKLFGGAQMLFSEFASRRTDVGIQNVQTAILTLKSKGLILHASHVGGVAGRKLYFNTDTGEVYLKLLNTGVLSGECLDVFGTNQLI